MVLQKQEQKLKSKKKIDLKNNKKVFLEYNVISTTTGKIN